MHWSVNAKRDDAARLPRWGDLSTISLTSIAQAERVRDEATYLLVNGVGQLLSTDRRSILLVAAQFQNNGTIYDLSHDGLNGLDPNDPNSAGLAQRGVALWGRWEKPNLLIASREPNTLAKSFMAGCMKGAFPLCEDFSGLMPIGVMLPALGRVIDHFNADLVHGWPCGNSRLEQVFQVANHLVSSHGKLEQLPKLVYSLAALFGSEDLSSYEHELNSELQRAKLAATFERQIFSGCRKVVAVRELDPCGFHPGAYCGQSGAEICVVSRSNQNGTQAHISAFCGTPEARAIHPRLGLGKLFAELNKTPINVDGFDLLWGGNFNRGSLGSRVQIREELSWHLACDTAEQLSNLLR